MAQESGYTAEGRLSNREIKCNSYLGCAEDVCLVHPRSIGSCVMPHLLYPEELSIETRVASLLQQAKTLWEELVRDQRAAKTSEHSVISEPDHLSLRVRFVHSINNVAHVNHHACV